MSLEGRAALVTGGSRRIGRSIALALARAGTDVAVTYRRSKADAQSVVRAIEGMGRRGVAIPADLVKPTAAKAAVDRTARAFGRLDILVNNVGEWVVRPVASTDLPTWQRILDTNLTATYVASKAAVPYMRRGGWGRIVNLGSAGSYRAHGTANMAAYYAAKAGVVAFSKALAREVGRHGITVNVVSPGVIQKFEGARRGVRRDRDAETAVGRAGTGEDVAAAVLFLVSEEASFVTGDVLGVTGGWLL